MNTYFGLLAEFGTAHIPLELIATRYLGMTVENAKRAASLRQLPVPAIRLGSQKSPWLVPAEDLAKYLEDASRAADFWCAASGELLTIEEIVSLAQSPEQVSLLITDYYPAGVYFLLRNSEVVYVGQAKHIAKRLWQHRQTIEFDSFHFIEIMRRAQRDVAERKYIRAIRPILNVALVPKLDS